MYWRYNVKEHIPIYGIHKELHVHSKEHYGVDFVNSHLVHHFEVCAKWMIVSSCWLMTEISSLRWHTFIDNVKWSHLNPLGVEKCITVCWSKGVNKGVNSQHIFRLQAISTRVLWPKNQAHGANNRKLCINPLKEAWLIFNIRACLLLNYLSNKWCEDL